MKQLRILTGFHAGAMLLLTSRQYQIHDGVDADIRLTDWTDARVTLDVDPSGGVSIVTHKAAPGGLVAGETVILTDFVPMRFGDTILCVGPHDLPWPSDLDLLSTLLAEPDDAQTDAGGRRRRHYSVALATCVALGVAVGAAVLLATAPQSEAAQPNGADYRSARIQQALTAAHMDELQVHTVGNASVVTGMVANLSDAQLVRSALEKIASKNIVRNYDVAQSTVHTIEDSLGIAGVRVKYLGNGDFAITGTVDSREMLDKAITRVRADLDSNIRRLVVQVAENPGTAVPDRQYSEIVSSDTVQYTQTPDGIKYVYGTNAPASPSAGSGASVAYNTPVPSIDSSTIARSVSQLH
ncbi:hypothetical protein WT83_16505 [Burkholderia territorii]|uniref:Secretion protein n=1 Tax=Burkholderia territorii TaxID=1503055 RepID=A0A108ENI4_9BURK|nr:hypothetical protein [Burkholderia territorii]KWN14694.1 hypothetical protein WT83_16505 [Burkholderia territorii]